MKRTIFYLVPIFSVLTILFSSCLGDSKSSISPDNSLSYITIRNNSDVAITQEGYYITSAFIKSSLTTGRFYYLRYDLDSDDSQVSGVYQLNSVGYGKGGTYPVQESPVCRFENLPNYETLGKNDQLRLTNFIPLYAATDNSFNDKWVFQCTVSAYKEDLEALRGSDGANNIDINIVKQETSQEKLEKNQVILDVYLTRKNPDVAIGADSKMQTETFLAVVDLSRLRSYFNGTLTSTNETAVSAYMQFQYYKYSTNNKEFETKVTKVGGLTGSNNVYYMLIGGKQSN